MTRPILVFGAGGRVAAALRTEADKYNDDFRWLSESDCNITDRFAVMELIGRTRPRAMINLAACALPQAETDREAAENVNSRAVYTLASVAAKMHTGAPIIHISTDCVFSGAKLEPYVPEDDPEAANWYGYTKLWGENAMRAANEQHPEWPFIIIRTTGVYLRNRPNFLETVLAKARVGEAMEVVSDTTYTPTDARELSKAILAALVRSLELPSVSGTYHFAGPDVMSYLDFARLVQEEAGVSGEIVPVTMADRERVEGFKRPKNASLNSDKFAETFGLRHRPTRECVRELVNPAN